jgi:hypothetical protein
MGDGGSVPRSGCAETPRESMTARRAGSPFRRWVLSPRDHRLAHRPSKHPRGEAPATRRLEAGLHPRSRRHRRPIDRSSTAGRPASTRSNRPRSGRDRPIGQGCRSTSLGHFSSAPRRQQARCRHLRNQSYPRRSWFLVVSRSEHQFFDVSPARFRAPLSRPRVPPSTSRPDPDSSGSTPPPNLRQPSPRAPRRFGTCK